MHHIAPLKFITKYYCSCENSYFILDDFNEKQDVTDTGAEKSHLFAVTEEWIGRRLQPHEKFTPKQSEFPVKVDKKNQLR